MALSTTTEDVAIKKELMKTHTYFEAIHKLKNYLKVNNKVSYKQVSDKKPEEIVEILKELERSWIEILENISEDSESQSEEDSSK